MKEDAKVLDEVVVVGMDTQKRNTITAAVATLKDDAIVNRPVTDVTSALQGNIAGLNFASAVVSVGKSVPILNSVFAVSVLLTVASLMYWWMEWSRACRM